MRSAYVDGGGHMVANLIKSTHKYDEYKTGCYKDALGPAASYFVCRPENIVKCSERQSLWSGHLWREPSQGIDPISGKEIGQLKQMLPLKGNTFNSKYIQVNPLNVNKGFRG